MSNELLDGKASTEQTANGQQAFVALQTVIGALHELDSEERRRVLDSASTFLGISVAPNRPSTSTTQVSSFISAQDPKISAPFSEDTSMSVKQFIMEKSPKTDVERIACLAYYLTHYRATPHFKTLDISLLNTEAAQPKFSNTAYSTNNAVKLNYLVPSAKGQRQLSALGERFVQALPDREAAKEVLLSMRRRNRVRRKKSGADLLSEEK
jgi:hypothetical protein